MRKDVLVYLAGPVTPHEEVMTEEHIAKALQIHLQLVKRGIPSFSPQLVAGYPSAWHIPWSDWMQYCLVMVSHCTHVLMLPRWSNSKGARAECDFAVEQKIPVAYTVSELLEMLEKR